MTEDGNGAAGLAGRLDSWRTDLAAWAIPDKILSAVEQSPWVLPREVFIRRASRVAGAPSGPSYERARDALDPPGSVLDVGSGAGTASLPLLPWCTALTAVDADADLLAELGRQAAASGVEIRLVPGRWPDVAAAAGEADVVTCHHVVYNVPDLEPFLTALTAAARRLVVIELTTVHPLTSLSSLWQRFWGLARPDVPTADDVLAILLAMGAPANAERWHRPGGRDYASFAELTDVTRRRLCLPPERAGDVAEALTDLGVDPAHPVDLGSSGREVVTIWWGRVPGDLARGTSSG
jgi:2-polyprenyl-3-methyl-5-hydroxy-6-metoxy-1,4-benzoquinol methylase